MTKSEKAKQIIDILESKYPDVHCGLEWGGDEPFRLFVMAVLSAQCTDKRVNEVSKLLFAELPDAKALAACSVEKAEAIIKPVGLYHTKAKNLIAASKMIIEQFGGEIPSKMENLLKLPGVGRKVANLLRGDIYGLGGIVADTHCIRISNRLGLAEKPTPENVEKSLDKLIPVNKQSVLCHRLVVFGREICTARKPACESCPLKSLCEEFNEQKI